MTNRILLCVMAVALIVAQGRSARAALMVLDEFDLGLGTLVSAGFDGATDQVWVYADFAADLRSYSRAGSFLSSISRPGESANDADITFAHEALTLGSTALSAGTLLFINGETDEADIYGLNPSTGEVLATQATSFGLSHVVGGAYHAGRNSNFLVQDRQPSGTVNDSVVAEIDPTDGNILNSFRITDVLSTYTVNFGDLDVGANGHLFIVSSDESTIAEFTATGVLVQELVLPSGVTSLSGIGLDNVRGEAWVSGTNGTLWRLGGLPSVPEPASLGIWGLGAMGLLAYRCRRRKLSPSTAGIG